MKVIKIEYDKWINKDNSILLITGISGAGKSTLTSEIARDNKETVIFNFDMFMYDNVEKYGYSEHIEKFFKEQPLMLAYRGHIHTKDDIFISYIKSCIDYIVMYSNSNSVMTIIEGVEFTRPEVFQYIMKLTDNKISIIVLEMTAFKATYRVFKRGSARRNIIKYSERLKFLLHIYRLCYFKNVQRIIRLHLFKRYLKQLGRGNKLWI